jgi:rfaE bifunctional protein nucleotidyltransferase chain/domain
MDEKSFDLLIEQVRRWRENGERIVLCHGCFDLLHIGHLLHFKAAKKLGDRLVVTVTPDRYVNKGDERPLFPEKLRLEMILALKVVDAAALNLWDSAVNTIKQLRPDYFAKGTDYRNNAQCNPNFFREDEEIKRNGGKMVFTDEETFSSTKIIEWVKNL